MEEQNINSSQQQQEIMSCFNYLKMALAHDTNTIRVAEQGLLQLSKNPQFIKILLHVPLVVGTSYEVSKLAVNYTRTYIRNLHAGQKHSTLITTAYHMIDFLSVPTVQLPLKQEVSESLIYLLQRERNKSLLLSCQQKLLELLNSATICDNVDDIKFEFIALFCHIVIQSVPMPLINHSQFLMQSFGSIIKICGVFINCIQAAIQEGKPIVEFCFGLLNIFLDTILKYLKKIKMLGIEIVPLFNNKDIKAVVDWMLNLALPDNAHNYPLFYQPKNQKFQASLIEQYHRSKQKILQILNQILTFLIRNIKDTEHKAILLMGQSKQFISIFISALNDLLNYKNYYQLNCTTMEVMGELYRYLGIMLNCKLHYAMFLSAKTMLLYGVIFKTLMFSPQDYANFTLHPDQFVNSVYHIIDYEEEKEDKEIKIAHSLQQPNEEELEVEQWGTVKTLAASLLISYTTHIDGSIFELIVMALSVLDSRTVQTKYRKDQFLLMLCIIRKNVQYMENMKFKIGQVLITSLRLRELPVNNKQMDINYDNVEYGMLIVAIDCYLPMIIQYTQLLCESLLLVVESIVSNQQVDDSIKMLTMGILTKIGKTQQFQSNSDKLMQLLWKMLKPTTVGIRTLDCLQGMIKQLQGPGKLEGKDAMKEVQNMGNNQNKKQQQIVKIVQAIIQLLQYYQTNKHQKIIIDKLWNILIEIATNTDSMPTLVSQFRQLLSALIHINNQQIVPTPKLCKCMCHLIKNSGMISDLEDAYVGIIYQQFYHGQAKCSLNQYYDLLQHILYYGVNQLSIPNSSTPNNKGNANGKVNKTVELILEMCIVSIREENIDGIPRGESECCEGILLLQSAIIALGKIFSQEVWAAILDSLCAKYKKDMTYDFTKAELTTNLMLVIVLAYNFFDHGLISQMLSQLLKNHSYFTYKNSVKLFTIGLIELIPLTTVPFVQEHYTKILDSVTSLLKLIQLSKDQQLELQELDSEEIYYYKLKEMTRNCFTHLDEFYLFQKEVENVKTTGAQLLNKSEKELSENKKQFLREILNVRKIGNNTRVIYKLKNK